MSRTLSRPMFRLGGSTSGITSGLDSPRVGYKTGGIDYDKAYETSQRITDKYYPRKGADLNRFLINWGLNMVGNPPSGNVLQTAARQAQKPTEELFESIDRSRGMRSATGADIFGKMIAAEGEAMGGGGDKWLKQWELKTVKNAYTSIIDNNIELDQLREDPEGNKNLIRELERENRDFEIDIAHLQKANPLVKALSTNEAVITNLYNSTLDKLGDIKVIVTEENKHLYPDNEVGDKFKKWDEDSPEIQAEAMKRIQIMFPPSGNIDVSFLEKTVKQAEGGRIGYQGGELVEDINVQETIQPEGMPGQGTPLVDPVGMSFEELRARLPATITDEIVILLSQSAQALEDFATIQTQQDVDNFNTKYNVNLVLPSEG